MTGIRDGNAEIAPADGKPEDVKEDPAPGTRKRRTKAEMEAAKQVETVVKDPAIDYDKLKVVVLDYVVEHGKPAAEKILGQFGVSKAQDLQPEQYAEAYGLFTSGVEDGDIA